MTPFPPKPKVVQENSPTGVRQPTLFPPKSKIVQKSDNPLDGMGFGGEESIEKELSDKGFTVPVPEPPISTHPPTSVKTIAKLVEIEVDGVTIDVDPTNGGIVLDRGELTKMKAKGTDCNKVKEAVDNVMSQFNKRIDTVKAP